MATTSGQVHKIYKLESIGYSNLHQQFTTLSADLAKIKKQIIELQGKKIGLSGKDLDDVNKKIVETSERQAELETKLAGVNEQGKASIGNYFQLNKAYQAAKKNAQDLAAAHGVESKEAIEAAATAAAYKEQLIAINNLVKTGGKPSIQAPVIPLTPAAATEVPFTTNLDQLAAERESLRETGDVVTELDRKQAEAAISATEFGNAQKGVADEVAQTGDAAIQVKTKYEQYTGSLRQNITAQIENVNALNANRAQQKEIQSIIGESGKATDAQIGKLAALKEEEQLLVETNKSLSVTVRNQAKEFISAAGSLDEQQAQLNQLQQAYEQLSETEKATTFGQGLKKEIDVLEPKVKSLEAELGKFSRNVGNYPQIFGGAFNVLEKEIESVQGKLVSGKFSGKELDDLRAKEAALNTMTKTLGTTFTSTTAQMAAYKEAGRQLAATFGTDSQVFKDFSKQVASGNESLKQTDVQLTKTDAIGGKFTGTLKKMYGGLRSLANLIPGFGISSLIFLLIAPLQALGTELFNVGRKSKDAGDGLIDLEKKADIASRSVEESSSKFAEAVQTVDELTINVNLARQGFLDKKKVVDQYNESMGKVTGQVRTLDEVEQQLTKNGPAYIEMMFLKAAANLALEEAAKQAIAAQKITLSQQTDIDEAAESAREAGKAFGLGEADVDEKDFEKIVTDRNKKRQTAIKKEQDGLKRIAADFQKNAAEIAKQFKFNFFEDSKTTEDKASKIDTALQEALKRIDTLLATEIAVENKRLNEILKIRELTFDEEIFHIKELERLNVEALNNKIALFQRQKKLNVEEQKTLAEFGEKKSDIELQTSKKINDIEKKRFDKGLKELEADLNIELKQIENNNKSIQDKITATSLEKAEAQLAADLAEQAAREKFYKALLALNDAYNKDAVQKAKEGLAALVLQINKDRNNLALGELKDIRSAGDKQRDEYQANYAKLRSAIINNDKLTVRQRRKALEKLAKEENFTLLSNELALLTIEFKKIEQLYKEGLKTEADYQEARRKLAQKQEEFNKAQTDLQKRRLAIPSAQNTRDEFTRSLGESLGFEEGSDEAKLLGEVIGQTFALATDAMNSFFDAERERIQQSLELNLQRLDMEKEHVLARAQSQAEIASIEKQYAAKRRAEERKAFEQMKKSKRAEAKLALAAELANLAVAAASAGASTGPAAPIVIPLLYALFAGLALGRYALRVGEINRETFAFGGQPGEVPMKGGKFGGRPHSKGGTDFIFKKKKYNAEVKELAVVRTKDAPASKQYTVTGNQMQIASAANVIGGGIDFKPGAKLKMFETGGFLGQNLEAPVFRPASLNNFINNSGGMSEEKADELIDKIDKHIVETSKRIDRIEVLQVTSSVTNAQKKLVQQSQIGTLG